MAVRKFILSGHGGTAFSELAAELNSEQLSVVTAPGGPLLVVAGAGSGKTRALTCRIVWLVEQGVDPGRIMLVTFTNRAAREMLNRVEQHLRQGVDRLWGGTFHHIANRILRRYGRHIGVDPGFTILDQEDSKTLLAACVVELGVDSGSRRFPNKAVLSAILSFARNTMRSVEDVVGAQYSAFAGDIANIQAIFDLYAVKKAQGQLLDFDDLLVKWLMLLEDVEEVRVALAERFQHLLVDEYQDTNRLQGRICDLMAGCHRNLCVVGDDSQSIYSFRGATFDNILDFQERYADARIIKLETNYRSTSEILELANRSIAHNLRRLPKELRAVRGTGLKPGKVWCHDHYVQSQFVAEFILQLLEQGRKLSDIAVLYRSHWHSLDVQLELQRHNIPFQTRGGLRFFEQAHVKDVLCYLRILHNPYDQLAWLRVLPHLPRVGMRSAQRFFEYVAATSSPLQAALSASARTVLPKAAGPFYEKLSALLDKTSRQSLPAEIIETVMADFYGDYLVTAYEQASQRREDIQAIAIFAAQYKTLDAFLADVALSGEYSGESVAGGGNGGGGEYVVLSTIHQAKGLEWPVVFVPWLTEGRFPAEQAMKSDENLEEERRVFHVAVTRAQDELYLITPKIANQRGQQRVIMRPSRFLAELPNDILEQWQVDEGLGQIMKEADFDETLPDDLCYHYDDDEDDVPF